MFLLQNVFCHIWGTFSYFHTNIYIYFFLWVRFKAQGTGLILQHIQQLGFVSSFFFANKPKPWCDCYPRCATFCMRSYLGLLYCCLPSFSHPCHRQSNLRMLPCMGKRGSKMSDLHMYFCEAQEDTNTHTEPWVRKPFSHLETMQSLRGCYLGNGSGGEASSKTGRLQRPSCRCWKKGLGNAKQKAQSQRHKLALCNKEQEIFNIYMIPLTYLEQVCLWVYTKQVNYLNNTFPLNVFEMILKSL